MQHGQLHHLECFVDDLEQSNQFWSWFLPRLGWRLRNTWDQGVAWVYPNGTYLCFVKTEDPHRHQRNNRHAAGFNHLAFYYESNVSQSVLVSELEGQGAKIVYDEENYICFEDPNGFAIELCLESTRPHLETAQTSNNP